MAITKLKQIGDWGSVREHIARMPRPVGRPRIIVGLLTGEEDTATGESPVPKQGRGSRER